MGKRERRKRNREGSMELKQQEWESSETFLSAFEMLIGDERTRHTFQGVIHGIIAGESLRAMVIARFSPCNGAHRPW